MDDLLGAEDRYSTICSRIYTSLESHLITREGNGAHSRFAPKNVAPDVLQDENLREFYRPLRLSAANNHGGLGIDEGEFVRRVGDRNLQPFVATLIYSGAPITAARAFVVNVVAHPHHIGNKLPLQEARLNEIFPGDPVTVGNFFINQNCFCTLTLFEEKSHMVLDGDEFARLPYIRQKEIGEGGFGHVWEVEIPLGHFVMRNSGEPLFPHGSKVVARKDYRQGNHTRINFENERDFCDAILRSPNRCDNVLLSYGTIAYSSGSAFSLFMPKADFDLRSYMEHHRDDNLYSLGNVTKHMSYAAGLARGVAHLHNGIESQGEGRLVCYHMDLKPDNVLIFCQDDEMIWKISDFGLSRIKALPDGSIKSTGNHLTVSPTQNPAGQGIYLAPESGSPRRMTRKSDVWSLGCIISVVCVWLQKGHKGVIDYAKSRTGTGDRSPTFYSPTLFGRIAPNPQIKEWHRVLIRDEKDVAIKGVLDYVLKYLENKIFLIEPSRRPEANELKEHLKRAAPRRPANSVISKSLRSFSLLIVYITKNCHSTSSVRGWPISFPVQGQACQFSPNGAILSYYSSFPTRTGDPLIEPTEVYSHPADIMDIGITKDYMVIAEKANNFRFSLVSFIDARSNGPCFNKQTPIHASAPSIHLIAISPLGDWIACVVKGNIVTSVPGRLYIAKRTDVQRKNSELNEDAWSHKDLPRWTNQDADNITSLSFSSESSIWFTVQPAPGCCARVARYVRDSNNPLEVFESAEFNGSVSLSCSHSFYHGKCIIATTGNRVVIHDFDHANLRGTAKRIDERIKIIKIVMSGDDRRILALVKPNDVYGELRVVELYIERSHTRVDVREIERINVQYLEYGLSKVQLKWVKPENNTETQNSTFNSSRALITVLARQHKNTVFEVNVPPGPYE
ncbi:hypothetical protein GGR51DRAFT_577581 [Nemania sp. FL0031]|nr:hypothetical protein GGR51DRAFT_577581 [Nemania sp. FL0031]